jgi:predicted O-linked N-acetylglucosamine transferase (SPINDLY family)
MASMTLDKALEAVIALQQSGQTARAEAILRQILTQQPDCAEAEHLLGILCAQSGRNDEGIALLRHAVQRHPDVPTFQINLASALFGAGQTDEAIESYRRVLAVKNDSAEAWSNLGSALIAKEHYAEAENSARQALNLRPDFAEAMVVLGNALLQQAKPDDAIANYQQAIALRPNLASAYDNLGLALTQRGRLEEALAAFERATALNPNSAAIFTNRSKTFRFAGRLKEAEDSARRAISIAPALAEAHVNLALALLDQGELDESIFSARRAVELRPNLATAHNVLANALKDAGQVSQAISEFDRAIQLRLDYPVDLSNKIYVMQFDPNCDAKLILAEQVRWDKLFGHPAKKLALLQPYNWFPNRRLKIGYVTAYFYRHSQAFFLVPLLENHDHQQFEIHCYSDAIHSDDVTRRIQQAADAWHNTASLSDTELAEKIRADKIDILIDLTMHMALNRAPMFALKPAPIQACWLAYPGGTGLSAMDYRITDPFLDPITPSPGTPGEGRGGGGSPTTSNGEVAPHEIPTEKPLRLPDTFWCYDPLSPEIDPGPLPATTNCHITFGSLNNFCKVNEAVLRLWARVMQQVDRSRMIILSPQGRHRESLLSIFESEGITRDRVELVKPQPRQPYLELYRRIDIGLDTFPYNGHTTSLDSYWMGVPVITLVGQTVVGRAGLSQLTNLGLTDLIATTPDEFVQIATKLCHDPARLSQLRQSLRSRMKLSPLMDDKRFARHMENAYREISKAPRTTHPKEATP